MRLKRHLIQLQRQEMVYDFRIMSVEYVPVLLPFLNNSNFKIMFHNLLATRLL